MTAPPRRVGRSHAGGERPSLLHGLAVVSAGDKLLIEGGPRRLRLTGSSDVLLRLLPLLDGHHDRDSVCSAVGLLPAQLDQALHALDGCGLLEAGGCASSQEGPPDHVSAYLSRVGGGQICLNGHELAAALQLAGALVVAPENTRSQIMADLAENGVATVLGAEQAAGLRAAELQRVAAAEPGIAAVFDRSSAECADCEFTGLVDECWKYGVPVLRFACSGQGLEVGPVFLGGYTACVRCFQVGRASLQWTMDRGDAARREVAQVLAGLVCTELLALLAQLTPPNGLRQLTRLVLPGYISEQYDVMPEPACGQCGRLEIHGNAGRDPEMYEWLMSDIPAALGPGSPDCASELAQFSSGLQTGRSDVPSAPRIVLTVPQPLPVQGSADRDRENWSCTEHALGDLLARVAGQRPDADGAVSRRQAPSGWNLGSAELYLLTDGTMIDLPGTIFKYCDADHAITAVHADRVPLAQTLASTDLDPRGLEFALVLVAAMGRLRAQYDSVSLRLGHLDAGFAAAQLCVAAEDYGWHVSFASSWPSELARLLEVEPGVEIITAVAGISRSRGR